MERGVQDETTANHSQKGKELRRFLRPPIRLCPLWKLLSVCVYVRSQPHSCLTQGQEQRLLTFPEPHAFLGVTLQAPQPRDLVPRQTDWTVFWDSTSHSLEYTEVTVRFQWEDTSICPNPLIPKCYFSPCHIKDGAFSSPPTPASLSPGALN